MEWSDEHVLMLIEEYRIRECLWEPSHPDYKILNKKGDAWRSLADVFEIDVAEIKKKINSLLASLRRERSKEKSKSGMAANEVYQSKWFAYKAMAFLLDKYKVKETLSSGDTVKNCVEEEVIEEDLTDMNTELVEDTPVELHTSTPVNDLKRQTTRPQQPSKLRKLDHQFNEALNVIKSVSQKIGTSKTHPQTTKSTDDVFGEYVASKLRNYTQYTKNFVQHKINNILFDADMGMFDPSVTPVSTSYPSTSQNSPSLLMCNDEGTQFMFVQDQQSTT